MSFTAYQRFLLALTRTRFTRRFFGPQVVTRLDRWLMQLTGGRVNSTGSGAFPTMVLETTGAKTGKRRAVPLIYATLGDTHYVVATNFGRAQHPAWSANLLAHPEVTILTNSGRRPVRARLLDAAEKTRLWDSLLETMPLWEEYRQMLDRDVRVFALEPRA